MVRVSAVGDAGNEEQEQIKSWIVSLSANQ
jgi:hypothetical protein